jgi:excisionase family DNA binding protein
MIQSSEESKLLNCHELAKRINVPVNTIYYWVSRKEIPFIKLGKHNRFDFQEVITFFKNKTSNVN